ncbi:Uma2 family endonuclease [Alienimonas sp. DA493]|uniref:Uma2 family endonuclease n=1 Tax=Alienimonas sp. DA493 TaxID=3373605 RepID=UPI00375521D1
MPAILDAPPLRPDATAAPAVTVADILEQFGDVPLYRIVMDPAPGTATEADIDRVKRETGRLCELIDGTLIEKAVGAESDLMGSKLIALLLPFVEARGLGWVLGGQGFLRLSGSRLRSADVAFVRYEQVEGDRFPSTPAYPALYPDLAIEILSPGNTAREMRTKRADCFTAGTRLVWEIDPAAETATVYTGVDQVAEELGADGTLGGRDVLPGFSVPLRDVLNAVRKTPRA